MKILVVEDEKKTLAFLQQGLTEHGFDVDIAENGEIGIQKALTGAFDLMILDVMVPRKDGWSILSEVRGNGLKTPVLFLTARDAVQDRVKGLQLGADDYLVKPFAFSELLARVQVLLRRRAAEEPGILSIADLKMDLVRQKATRHGKNIDLSAKEFILLSMLARQSGTVLSRRELSSQVWEMDFDCETNVVDVAIRRLRSKVDDPYPNKLIHTVRGVGYVLEEK